MRKTNQLLARISSLDLDLSCKLSWFLFNHTSAFFWRFTILGKLQCCTLTLPAFLETFYGSHLTILWIEQFQNIISTTLFSFSFRNIINNLCSHRTYVIAWSFIGLSKWFFCFRPLSKISHRCSLRSLGCDLVPMWLIIQKRSAKHCRLVNLYLPSSFIIHFTKYINNQCINKTAFLNLLLNFISKESLKYFLQSTLCWHN